MSRVRITIRQIAEMANVSRGTVDKILHNRPGVSDEVRKKVQNIIEEYDYAPNRMARALVGARQSSNFAVIMPDTGNQYYADIKSGMDHAAKELSDYGMRLEYYYLTGADPEELPKIIDYLVSQKLSGVAVRNPLGDTHSGHLNRFAAQGVPVLTFDSDIPDIDRFCYVGEDQVKSGRMGASLIAKLIGGAGEVAVFTGFRSVYGHRKRVQGFCDAMNEKHPHIRIVEVCETLEQNTIIYAKMLELLETHPNLKGVFDSTGRTLPLANALVDTGNTHRIKLVTYNFSPDIRQLLQDGIVDFTIGLTPFKQGALAIETLFKYAVFGEKPDAPQIKTPVYIGFDENLGMFGE